MLRVVRPDFEVKIGIKDGEAISIDWGGLRLKNPSYGKKDIVNLISILQKYLSSIQSHIRRGR